MGDDPSLEVFVRAAAMVAVAASVVLALVAWRWRHRRARLVMGAALLLVGATMFPVAGFVAVIPCCIGLGILLARLRAPG